ncbi:hypothetical protein CBR_g41633 [Chara braunii]|uniref:Uncharacterized protein n=1 Tax=Chara braunii TaxID=69332 RepID=A0A388LWC4_CHABU|nr:hypothetical protein CBR_g41633 [Chara braunii]|eukprot:GBG86571.1 hypothetical protein CBR_g41633 [Chara braunii]
MSDGSSPRADVEMREKVDEEGDLEKGDSTERQVGKDKEQGTEQRTAEIEKTTRPSYRDVLRNQAPKGISKKKKQVVKGKTGGGGKGKKQWKLREKGTEGLGKERPTSSSKGSEGRLRVWAPSGITRGMLGHDGSNGEVGGVGGDVEMASGVGDLDDGGGGDELFDGIEGILVAFVPSEGFVLAVELMERVRDVGEVADKGELVPKGDELGSMNPFSRSSWSCLFISLAYGTESWYGGRQGGEWPSSKSMMWDTPRSGGNPTGKESRKTSLNSLRMEVRVELEGGGLVGFVSWEQVLGTLAIKDKAIVGGVRVRVSHVKELVRGDGAWGGEIGEIGNVDGCVTDFGEGGVGGGSLVGFVRWEQVLGTLAIKDKAIVGGVRVRASHVKELARGDGAWGGTGAVNSSEEVVEVVEVVSSEAMLWKKRGRGGVDRRTTRVGMQLGWSKKVRGNTRVIAEVAIVRRHPRGWRDGVVVGYLRVGKMKIPLLVVTNNLSENISESPVRDLGLTIRLRMVRRGKAELGAIHLVEPSPESADKARVTVRYDAQR